MYEWNVWRLSFAYVAVRATCDTTSYNVENVLLGVENKH